MMKFRVFNNLSVPPSRVLKKPTVALNGKSGVIRFNKSAIDLLLIKEGGGIEFLQDEEREKDWYVRVSSGEGAFVLKAKQGVLYFSNVTMAKTMLQSLKIQGNSATFLIAGQPTDGCFAILTSQTK